VENDLFGLFLTLGGFFAKFSSSVTLHTETAAHRPPGTAVAPWEVLWIPPCCLADCLIWKVEWETVEQRTLWGITKCLNTS